MARSLEPLFDVPRAVDADLEVAVSAPPAVRQRLAQAGWRLADPLAVTRTPARYQEYVRASRAEFSVAKHGYVAARSGWFSDRSTAYLASGRPVVVEDTGFSAVLPCGRGVLPFQDRPGAIAALRALSDDYEAHCRAAREIAEAYFDARHVLGRLLEAAVEPSARLSAT
jgi:hypothetical protein